MTAVATMRRSSAGSIRRVLRALAILACAGVPATGIAAMPAAASASAVDPAALVNPFIGTGNGGKVAGNVDTFPGAVVPFGMLSWSPATTSRPAGGDYFYGDHAITGFGLTHISGPGCSITEIGRASCRERV